MDSLAKDRRWLIIADDLTGAADSAIAFAKRRLPARVTWGEPSIDEPSDVVAVAFDADSRQLPRASAAQRHREILRRLLAPDTRVFKKIDSTLRGHPADEIGAMIDVLAARQPHLSSIFAPAFPAGGRVTRGGRVFVHGVPLDRTEFWNPARLADHADHADLAGLLETAGLHARLIPLDVVRGAPARLRGTFDDARGNAAICVCDAETEDDLDRIAATGLEGDPSFFAGSAGLAHSLAKHAALSADLRFDPVAGVASRHGALLLVGSQAGPSRAGLAPLETVEDLRRYSVDARSLLHPEGDAIPLAELDRALTAGVDVLIDVAPPADGLPAVAPRVVDALARRIAPLAANASALMATGGDTAAALLAHCGVRGIRLVDELEPGTSLGLTLGALTLPVITKSGGFGDAGSLRRIVERLRFIRHTGTVA
jgi:D-threonate/D-erythronate kinase